MENVDGELAGLESSNYDLGKLLKLQKSQRYNDIMQKVGDALQKDRRVADDVIVLEDDIEYQLVVHCNALLGDIDNEIFIIHKFIRDNYRPKFSYLESLIHDPIDYARIVKKFGNEMDLTEVDLAGILPPSIIMEFSASICSEDRSLPEDVLQKTVEACDCAIELDSARKSLLGFVESRMIYIAPNLSAIAGSAVAAKLMGTAGGLAALAKMPASYVQHLGAKEKCCAGFLTQCCNVGYIGETKIFQSTPPPLRMCACLLLASILTLAARVDATEGDSTGKTGKTYLEKIREKIEKWQQSPPTEMP